MNDLFELPAEYSATPAANSERSALPLKDPNFNIVNAFAETRAAKGLEKQA